MKNKTTKSINGSAYLPITNKIKKEFVEYLTKYKMKKTELSQKLKCYKEFVRNIVGDRQKYIRKETYDNFKKLSGNPVSVINGRITITDKMKNRILKWLETSNVAQGGLSRAVGFSNGYIYNIINGSIKRVHVETWKKILGVMNGDVPVQPRKRERKSEEKSIAETIIEGITGKKLTDFREKEPEKPFDKETKEETLNTKNGFFDKFTAFLDGTDISEQLKGRIVGVVFDELLKNANR